MQAATWVRVPYGLVCCEPFTACGGMSLRRSHGNPAGEIKGAALADGKFAIVRPFMPS